MLTTEQNERLCRVEGEAPMGQLMRRHWIPALLSEEVAVVDGTPVAVRLFGEDLVPVELPLRWYVVLVPPCSVPTAVVFRSPDLTRNAKSVKIEDFPACAWSFPAAGFRNDLESVVCAEFSAVARALLCLRGFDAGALITARMSGSGSCVFAAFDSREKAHAVLSQKPADCGGFVASGLARHPLKDCAGD